MFAKSINMSKLLLPILFCVFLGGCTTDYSAVYQSVSAESKWDEDESARIIISNSNQELSPFLVNENTLYLMIQVTQLDWFIHSVTNYPSWDKAEINRLLENHHELKSLIPADWNNWLPPGYGDECKPNNKSS